MRLYDLAQEYQEILSKTFDQETGEVNENAIALLEIMKSSVEEKAIAVASYIKNLDAEREAIIKAKHNMADRELSLESRMEWLSKYLQSNMQQCGISEVKCPYFVIKLKKCPISTDVFDETLIPEDFIKRKEVISIDKVGIKANLLEGLEVPGAQLKQNLRLEIK